jgi:hypothetical protein
MQVSQSSMGVIDARSAVSVAFRRCTRSKTSSGHDISVIFSPATLDWLPTPVDAQCQLKAEFLHVHLLVIRIRRRFSFAAGVAEPEHPIDGVASAANTHRLAAVVAAHGSAVTEVQVQTRVRAPKH